MIFKKLLLLLLSLTVYNSYAQNLPQGEGMIMGRIVNADNNKSIEYATVRLYLEKDSVLVTGIYTDKDGNTFESIEFHNAAVEHSLEEDIENLIVDKETNELEADLNTLENKKDYDSGSDFDLDFNTNDIEKNEEQSDFF